MNAPAHHSYNCPVCGASIEPSPARFSVETTNQTRPPEELRCSHCNCTLRIAEDDQVMIDMKKSDLRHLIDQVTNASHAPDPSLLLDFEDLKFLSGEFLGDLIQLQKTVAPSRSKVVLCNLGPLVKQVFSVTKLDSVFTLRS